jgi:Tol biopolymer transport system component
MPRPILSLLLLPFVTAGVLFSDDVQPARPHRQYSIEQLKQVAQYAGMSFSHDGRRVLFSSNASGSYNVYTIPAAGGQARALSHSTTRAVYAVSYFPHDDRVLVTHDREGDENSHLYLLNLKGEEVDLTPGEESEAAFKGWSGDGTTFFYAGNARSAKAVDVYRVDIATSSREMVFKNDGSFDVAAVSPNGRWIALTKSTAPDDADIYLYDAERHTTRLLTPHNGAVSNRPHMFDSSSRALYFLSDEGSEFKQLRRCNLRSGRIDVVDTAPADIAYARVSKNGTLRIEIINIDGRGDLRIVDTRSGRPLPVPDPSLGNINEAIISPDESTIAYYADRDSTPENLFVFDRKTRRASRLTNALTSEIDPGDLVDGTTIRFPSFDGMQIPALLYKPLQASSTKKSPAIVWVHGGPGG